MLSIGLYRKDLHGVIGTESTGQVCNPLADSTESNDQRCELDGTIGFSNLVKAQLIYREEK